MAEAGASAFLIDRFNPLPQYGPQPQQAARSRQPTEIDIATDDPLYHVENLTDQYYQRANALEGFAKMAYDKYDIDVTTPSFGNPHAMALHKIYLKGLASTQMAGNQLRNAQKMYETAANNPNYHIQVPQDEVFNQQRHVTNLNVDKVVQERNKLATKDYTKQEADEFNQGQQQVKERMEQTAKELREQGDTGMAIYYERAADTVQFATPSAEEEGKVAKQGADIALRGAQVDTQKSMQAENYAQARAADALAEKRLKELEDSGEINEVDGRLSFLQETVGFNGEPNEANLRAFFGGSVENVRLVEEQIPGGEVMVKEIILNVTNDTRKLFEKTRIPKQDEEDNVVKDPETGDIVYEEYEVRDVLRFDDPKTVVLDISTIENQQGAMYVLNAVLNKIYGTEIRPEQLSQTLVRHSAGRHSASDSSPTPSTSQTTQTTQSQPIDLGFAPFDNL